MYICADICMHCISIIILNYTEVPHNNHQIIFSKELATSLTKVI